MPFWESWAKPNIGKLKAERDVEGLVKALKYKKDKDARQNAAEILGGIGDARAVEPLITALEDEDEYVRQAVAEALGRLGDVRAAEPLIAALNYLGTGRAAAKALGNIGDARAVEPLIGLLKYPKRLIRDWEIDDKVQGRQLWQLERQIRALVAETLVKIGQPSVEPLIVALGHHDSGVVEEAASALGAIGDSRAVEPLITALGHPKSEVVEEAASALGAIGDSRAFEPLIAALAHDSLAVVDYAVLALEAVGDPRTVEALIVVLQHAEPSTGERVAKLLGKIGDSRAIDPLLAACSSVGSTAADALTSMGWEPSNNTQKVIYLVALNRWDELVQLGQPAVEPLIQLVESGHFHQGDIAGVLGEIGDNQAIPQLSSMLQSGDYLSKIAAAEALVSIGHPQGVLPLVDFLRQDAQAADKVVDNLRQLLEKCLGEVSTADLQAITHLGTVTQLVSKGEIVGGVAESWMEKKQLDVSHLRQLARQELIRRGEET